MATYSNNSYFCIDIIFINVIFECMYITVASGNELK